MLTSIYSYMSESMKTISKADSITPSEWRWVQELIAEVQRQERGVAFAQTLGQWDLAVRQFRKAEQRHFLDQSPSAEDLDHHALCLRALLGLGRHLATHAQRLTDQELAGLGVRRGEIVAYLEDL